MEKNICDEELKAAFEMSAKIVALHGEAYLPIFERLEREYEARLESKKALDRAKDLSDRLEH